MKHDKPIWPDYDLQYDDFRAGAQSFVRKQDNKGVWKLIPVIMRYEGNINKDVTRKKELLDFLKRFNTECYKVLLFYKFPDEPVLTWHGATIEIVDDIQESEQDRLIVKPIKIEDSNE